MNWDQVIEIQKQLYLKEKVQQYGLQHPENRCERKHENKHFSIVLRIPAPASLSLCVLVSACVFFHSQLRVSLSAPEWSHIDLYWFWRVSFLLNQSTAPTGLCSLPCIVHSHFKPCCESTFRKVLNTDTFSIDAQYRIKWIICTEMAPKTNYVATALRFQCTE